MPPRRSVCWIWLRLPLVRACLEMQADLLCLLGAFELGTIPVSEISLGFIGGL
jgi:hypothetical protein